MDLDQQLQKFLIFIVESRPGLASLGLLAGLALAVWLGTVMLRWIVWVAVSLARAVLAAVTSVSTLVAACVVLAVFALTR
jgi:hypothetical protein